MSTEEQLISFFAYSFLIYPVTNYLVSPHRSYKRAYGVIFAIIFLGGISYMHMRYETREHGPNHYELLGVSRATSISELKRTYRNLSRELHPDRNKSPTASEDFGKIKHAFDIIVNPELRHVYDRMGDAAARTSEKTVIDYKYMIIQMLVYYCSTSILAFFMTFSEPSGESLSVSFFGMTVMLLVESAFILKNIDLPAWGPLATTTPHEIISTLHRLFPAFMSGCRCIISAFHVEIKDRRIDLLDPVIAGIESVTANMLTVIQSQIEKIEYCSSSTSISGDNNNGTKYQTPVGVFEKAQMLVKSKIIDNTSVNKMMSDKINLINNPDKLKQKHGDKNENSIYNLIINYIIFFMARLMIIKFMTSSSKNVT